MGRGFTTRKRGASIAEIKEPQWDLLNRYILPCLALSKSPPVEGCPLGFFFGGNRNPLLCVSLTRLVLAPKGEPTRLGAPVAHTALLLVPRVALAKLSHLLHKRLPPFRLG